VLGIFLLVVFVNAMMIYLRYRYEYATASVERGLRFFRTDVDWLLVVRAIIVHKNYCSELVYIPKPLDRVTNESHIL